jgi:four helix bundle protein
MGNGEWMGIGDTGVRGAFVRFATRDSIAHGECMSASPKRPRLPIRDYKDIVAWQSAVQLAAECHNLVRMLPPEERFDLGRQIRRASVSVSGNIAEGNGRFHRADYLRFLSTANASLHETESHLLVARECGYLGETELERALQLTAQTGRLLIALVKSLRTTGHP